MHGSTLSSPIRPDRRGTLATVSDRVSIVEQSIRSIIETRQGERVLMPDYGIPDFVFSVVDASFAARLAFAVEQQIKNYEPLVERVRVIIGSLNEEGFQPGHSTNPHSAALRVEYSVRGSNVPLNLTFPVWKLIE